MDDLDRTAAAASEGADWGADHTLITDRLPAGVWVLDYASSQVNFRARTMFGLLPVNGYFNAFDGMLTVDADGNAHGALNVRTATIRTGIDRRDQQLCSREFFDASAHPEMTFALEQVSPGFAQQLDLVGTLQIRDREVALSFPATAIRHGDHLHIEARVVIDHHQAGLHWAKPGLIGKRARAELALTLRPAIRQ